LFWKRDQFEEIKSKLGKDYKDYTMYFDYVRFCLEKLDFPTLKWTKRFTDEGWTFVIPARDLRDIVPEAEDWLFGVMYETRKVPGGMSVYRDEDIVKAWREKRIINYYPDDQKVREFKIYRYWWNIVTKLCEKIRGIVEEWWRVENG